MSTEYKKVLLVLPLSFLFLLSVGCGSSGSSDSGAVLPSGSPEITVLGSNPRHLVINDVYVAVEPGAEAWDAEDGNLTSLIDFNASNVDMSTAGTYKAIYSVTDSDGNTATAYRIELVVDPGAEFMYEDAEDNNTLGWFNFDNDPVGATIANVDDNGNRVIELNTAGTTNGYELRFERYDGTFVDWNDADHINVAMDMNYTSGEQFKIIVKCGTDAGLVWVTYANYAQPASDTGIWFDINSSITAGDQWESFSTSTLGDLGTAIFDDNNTNTLNEIDGIRIKGTMRVDNIRTLP